MSGEPTKRARRREQKTAQARNRARDRVRRHIHTIVFAVGVILLILLIGRTAYRSGALRSLPGTPVPIQSNEHIPSVDTPHPPYNSLPPTSGWHVATLVPWGVHKTPIPNERQVHNLEDGGVLVQYNCEESNPEDSNPFVLSLSKHELRELQADCTALIAELEALAHRHEFVIVAPYPEMTHRIALTAWGRIQTLAAYDEAQVTAFISTYAGLDHHPRGF